LDPALRGNSETRPLVLLVDDDIRGELCALPKLLEGRGYTVRCAQSFSEAERAVAELQTQEIIPVAAVVDWLFALNAEDRQREGVDLPDKVGASVVEMVRNAFPSTPLFMLTVVGSQGLPTRIRDLASGIFTKPSHVDEILDAIDRARVAASRDTHDR
jgi:ActR/RegA family two-component response regulator